MNTTFIYGLLCPLTNTIRYIGKSDNPAKRLGEHISDRNVCHRTKWLERLRKLELRPSIVIIDEVSANNWQYWESYYIFEYRAKGAKLVNGTDGGDGITGYRHTKKTIKKHVELMKTYRPTEKTKEKISKSLKGKLPANHRMLVLKGAAATSKKVIRFTKDGKKAGEFVSISEAARCMGITPASISVAIKKKTPSKNYYWKYGA